MLSVRSGPKLRIGFILAKSFTLSAFALFVDTLRLASDMLDKSGRVLADWDALSATRQTIRSSCGIDVAPTASLADPARFDYVVVVGGLRFRSSCGIDVAPAASLADPARFDYVVVVGGLRFIDQGYQHGSPSGCLEGPHCR